MQHNNLPCRIAAVLWDFDDTLVDSLPARVHALTQVFHDANIRGVDPEGFLLSIAGKTLQATLPPLAESHGSASDLFEQYRRIYWTKKPSSLRLYPGIEAALDGLQQRGVLLAIVTSKGRSLDVEGIPAGVSAELEELGIAGRFPVVVGLEDVSEPKPHPEGVLRALEQLGVEPERALMVGDSVADIEAAKAAGCWSCLATWGVPDGADRARRANADLVAETPGGVLRFVG